MFFGFMFLYSLCSVKASASGPRVARVSVARYHVMICCIRRCRLFAF